MLLNIIRSLQILDNLREEMVSISKSELEALRANAGRYEYLKEYYHGFQMFKDQPFTSLNDEVDKAIQSRNRNDAALIKEPL